MLGGSDAGAHLDLMCHANYPTVVLGEVVRERGLLSLPQAVEMMTDRPARHYGLAHRGRVAPGWFADLVVFDPAEVGSRPTEVLRDLPGGGERLCAASRGIAHVFVGGREVMTDGAVTGRTPRPRPPLGSRHRNGHPLGVQAVAAPSMTRVVPLMVAASSDAK